MQGIIIRVVSVLVNGVNLIVLPTINQMSHLQELMFSPFQEHFSNLSVTACFPDENNADLLANHHLSLSGSSQPTAEPMLGPEKHQPLMSCVLPAEDYFDKIKVNME